MRSALCLLGQSLAIAAICAIFPGCGTLESGVIWAPERIAYHAAESGDIQRVEQYDDDDVCRRILVYAENGKLKLIQERDESGVCRRSTYYNGGGRVLRVVERDADGSLRDTTRFNTGGAPVEGD